MKSGFGLLFSSVLAALSTVPKNEDLLQREAEALAHSPTEWRFVDH
jgi:hypothetical protein